jgi:hypothetical protein
VFLRQEHFIQKLTESAYANARLDQRSTVQYRDLGKFVASIDVSRSPFSPTPHFQAKCVQASEEFFFLEGKPPFSL